ncbi:MAG: isoleucine--tRNA ligase [Acidimicrobiales bacterium]
MTDLVATQPQGSDLPDRYPEVPAQPQYPVLEEEILSFWAKDKTFEASVELNSPETEYVFYDGPPFANGLPHYGHLLTGFVKDAVPRYQTMRGRRVERRFGWDCHGLPAEIAAENELGWTGRQAIITHGIGAFNDYCRSLVMRTADSWERYVTRQARWVDFGDDYKTLDLPFMESVIWAFKQLYDRGLAYEGYRVLPYCWECETPLSHSETRQDDAYRERTDPAVTVLFDIEAAGEPGERPDISGPLKMLVWTTTPWTLPSNLALAVGPGLDYDVCERAAASGTELLVVGTASRNQYAEELEGTKLLGSVKGSELVGRHYRPLFGYFSGVANSFRVVAGDFVVTGEGTGIVHMAPGFGEDDQRVCESEGIEVVCPVDEGGHFTSEVSDFAGLQVFDANQPIIDALSAAGAMLKVEQYTHSYPHCWRTDTPLIYRAVSSWFIRVTAVKAEMVALNQQISWVPEHVRDGAFGKWLEGARDWNITRNRFWGTPIPVWKSDDPDYPRLDVYGSLDELERDFGVRPDDLHRPMVDELTRPNPDDPTGLSTMRRIEDVLDCWFESGSMPFAQLHYPFENRERFEAHFPADFIVEYITQTRGWFYTLHVLSTALFGKPPFLSCVVHGVVLGDDGRKLSKRLRNFPDPEEVFAEQGADAMRWYLLSSAVLRGQDVIIESKGLAAPIRLVLNPIWNTWYFLSLYSNADRLKGRFRTDQTALLDRYLLAKTHELVGNVTGAMERYDFVAATSAITAFLDALTNWYVRRSRERFWRPAEHRQGMAPTGVADDKQDAYDTLHTVLDVLCRVACPFLPYLTETVYQGLTGERSVHLTSWPEAADLPKDQGLVEAMDLVREVCSAGHSIRKAAGRRARLPLSSVTIATTGTADITTLTELIADELNVKQVVLSKDVGAHAERVLAVVPAALGPRLGRRTQEVIAAVREGNWSATAGGGVEAAGIALEPGEYSLRLVPRDAAAGRLLPNGDGVVWLDLAIDDDLVAEGMARDLVRIVQNARKQAGLHVSDRIELQVTLPAEAVRALEGWVGYVTEQTLATSLELVPLAAGSSPQAEPSGSLSGSPEQDLPCWIQLRQR